jgi:hypothetical protein
MRPQAVDSGLMSCVSELGDSEEANGISTNNYLGYDS